MYVCMYVCMCVCVCACACVWYMYVHVCIYLLGDIWCNRILWKEQRRAIPRLHWANAKQSKVNFVYLSTDDNLKHPYSNFIRALFPDDISPDKKTRPTTVGSKIKVSGHVIAMWYRGVCIMLLLCTKLQLWNWFSRYGGSLVGNICLAL